MFVTVAFIACRKSHRLEVERPSLLLIPVPVTGIQPPRVCAVNNSYRKRESSAPKDLGLLDP
ncbi:integrase [Rhizobium sp. J15]|nr:integrase [Rhizobium sp. J15]